VPRHVRVVLLREEVELGGAQPAVAAVVDVQHTLDGNRRLLLALRLLLLVPLLLVARVPLAVLSLLRRLAGLGLLGRGLRATRGRLWLALARRLHVGDLWLRFLRRGHVAVGDGLALHDVAVLLRRRDVAVGSGLVGALVRTVVLDVDDAALRIERRRGLILPVLALAALAATPAAAAALPPEPASAAAFTLLALSLALTRLTAEAVGPILCGLRVSRVARLGRIR
jgi:hypothetical protein